MTSRGPRTWQDLMPADPLTSLAIVGVSHSWSLLGDAVRPPAPYVWLPEPPSPVDEAILRRVIAGLERLGSEHRQPAAHV